MSRRRTAGRSAGSPTRECLRLQRADLHAQLAKVELLYVGVDLVRAHHILEEEHLRAQRVHRVFLRSGLMHLLEQPLLRMGLGIRCLCKRRRLRHTRGDDLRVGLVEKHLRLRRDLHT